MRIDDNVVLHLNPNPGYDFKQYNETINDLVVDIRWDVDYKCWKIMFSKGKCSTMPIMLLPPSKEMTSIKDHIEGFYKRTHANKF